MAGLLDTIRSRVQDDPVAQYLADTYKGMGLLASDTAKNTWSGMDTLDRAALATSTVPVVGDVVGLANDVRYLYKEPSLINAAMMGLGAIPLVPSLGTIKAYHGSPHKFDRFSMDAIGTGEGAQSYGHGLYFAENPKVAGEYREQLSRNFDDAESRLVLTFDDKKIPLGFFGNNESLSDVIDSDELIEEIKRAADAWDTDYSLKGTGFDFDEILDDLIREKEKWKGTKFFDPDDAAEIEKLKKYKGKMELNVEDQGNLYNVNIDVNHEDLLDWDAPLSEQPEKVKQALNKVWQNDPELKEIMFQSVREGDKADILYSKLTDHYNQKIRATQYDKGIDPMSLPLEQKQQRMVSAQSMASEALKEAGIPGIRYLDQGSRNVTPLPDAAKRIQDAGGDLDVALGKIDNEIFQAENIGIGQFADDVDINTGELSEQAYLKMIRDSMMEMKDSRTRNLVIFDDSLIEIVPPKGLLGK